MGRHLSARKIYLEKKHITTVMFLLIHIKIRFTSVRMSGAVRSCRLPSSRSSEEGPLLLFLRISGVLGAGDARAVAGTDFSAVARRGPALLQELLWPQLAAAGTEYCPMFMDNMILRSPSSLFNTSSASLSLFQCLTNSQKAILACSMPAILFMLLCL